MTDPKDKKINDLTKQITQNNSTITSLNQQISNLKTENNNKEAKIKSLTNDVANRDKTIKEKQNNIDNLNKQLTEKTNSEKNKNEENAKLNTNINKLKEELNKLKSDNENRNKELLAKDSKIKEFQDKIKNNEEELKKLKENNNIISLENEKLKKIIIIPTNPLKEENNHNDIIINFQTIQSIKEGWLIKFSELGLKYFNDTIKCPKIGILGNQRVGKSFLLSKLFGFSYSQNPINSNEKISIQIKQRKNKIKFIIFDSQGLNNPLVDEKIINEKNDINNKIEKEEEEKKNDKIKKRDNNQEEDVKILSNNYFNLTSQELDEIKNNKNMEELKTNKFLTDEFITNFMIDYSDILIVAVGILNHSDQILLNKVMEECVKKNKKNLYVIHNLQSFINKEQVNDYVKNILMNSATFNLESKKEIKIDDLFDIDEEKNKENLEEDNDDNNPEYYTSVYKSLTVIHLIFINNNCEEKSFNNFTKKKLETFFNISQRSEFNFQEKIKSKILQLLKDYCKNEIKEDNLKFEENKSENNSRKIIYKTNESLKLKRYLKNEESNTRSEFRPNFSYYISNKDGKEKLNILIEAPGEITDEKITPMKTENNKNYLIQYRGKKSLNEEEITQKDNIKIVGREFGEFILDVSIPLKDYEILNLDEPECHREKGIEIIRYELKNNSNINIELNDGVNSKGEENKKSRNNC